MKAPVASRHIILVSGAPGAGKTTLALALSALLGAPLLSKDTIKEAIWDALDPPAGDREWSKRTGAAAMEVLWALARSGSGFILEANFRPHSQYEQRRIAQLDAEIIEVYCWCDPAEAARRYAQRARLASHHPAHVTPELAPDLLAEFDGPMNAGRLIRVDTSSPVDATEIAAEILRWVALFQTR